MTVSINGSAGLTFNDGSTQNTSPFTGGFGFRNRIINGAMVIDQRNAGAAVTPLNVYTLDRWRGDATVASKYTVQQNAGSVTPPIGYTNYLGCTSSSAYTVGASELFGLRQIIEGFNVADLAWGTASAATVTLSFWVRSSLIGTFGGVVKNNGGSRSYPFAYTISAANTWEQKSVTIAGDTSGTWLTTNGTGFQVFFSIGAGATASGTAGSWSSTNYSSATGATSVVGTNGATFYITGVQLEKGSTATSFDYRPYGTELQLAQRYYWQQTNAVQGNSYSMISGVQTSTVIQTVVPLPTTMRASPTIVGSNFSQSNMGATPTAVSGTTFNGSSLRVGYAVTGATAGNIGFVSCDITANAEL